jgi:DNA uptake protein ComE-like DNA-binding protein
MSITQAKRVMRFRDERAFSSVDELDDVPGFSQAFLSEIKSRIVP